MKEYLKPIGALRGIFCLVIVGHHYFSVFRVGFLGCTVFESFFRMGYLAVDMFFLLSGFCMVMNHEMDLAADRKKILPFLAKHYLKLVMYSVITMPAWIAKQLLCYPAGLDVEMDKSKIILDILCVRTGWYVPCSFPYNGPMWFANILFIVYIIYVLICLAQSFCKKFDISLVLYAVFALAAYVCQLTPDVNVFIWQGTTRRGIAMFFIGCLVYRFYKHCQEKNYKTLPVTIISYVLAIASAVLFVLYHDKIDGDIFIRIYMLTCWPEILWLALTEKWFTKLLSIKPLVVLGKFSNSVFIWHHPIFYILFSLILLGKININLGSPLCIIGYLLTIAAIGFASREFIEKYILKLINRIK